jgi:predicted enzyme related to lactoylglutathione lyase
MKALMLVLALAAAGVTFVATATAVPFEPTQDAAGEEAERADAKPRKGIRIAFASIMVEDQDEAERFYTEVMGFVVKTNIDLGAARWLTVASPAGVDGVELLLEPNDHPAAQTFMKAMKADGIPWTTFPTDDLDREYKRLKAKGVEFTVPPTTFGDSTLAIFDDTCGNLIQLHQE